MHLLPASTKDMFYSLRTSRLHTTLFLHYSATTMLFLYTLIFIPASWAFSSTSTDKSLILNSAAFANSSAASTVVYGTTDSISAERLGTITPTINIGTTKPHSAFLVMMSYNYTDPSSSSSPSQISQWSWVQTDLTLDEASSLPDDQWLQTTTLETSKPPLYPFHSPEAPISAANLTLQVWEQTDALKSYYSPTASVSDQLSKLRNLVAGTITTEENTALRNTSRSTIVVRLFNVTQSDASSSSYSTLSSNPSPKPPAVSRAEPLVVVPNSIWIAYIAATTTAATAMMISSSLLSSIF